MQDGVGYLRDSFTDLLGAAHVSPRQLQQLTACTNYQAQDEQSKEQFDYEKYGLHSTPETHAASSSGGACSRAGSGAERGLAFGTTCFTCRIGRAAMRADLSFGAN